MERVYTSVLSMNAMGDEAAAHEVRVLRNHGGSFLRLHTLNQSFRVCHLLGQIWIQVWPRQAWYSGQTSGPSRRRWRRS